MGSELYRREPAFRAEVEACCAVAPAEDPGAVLANFADPPRERVLSPFDVGLTITILHLAQTALWRDRGIEPAATFGVSLGEVAAAHVAGALTRAEAMRVAAAGIMWGTVERRPHVLFAIATTSLEAKRLIRLAPVPMQFIGSNAPDRSLVLATLDVARPAREHLARHADIVLENESGTAYHTPRSAAVVSRLEHYLTDLTPRPARIEAYCASAGGPAAGVPMDRAFWRWMISHPFYIDEAVGRAIGDGFNTVVVLGASATPAGWFTRWSRRRRPIRAFASMEQSQDEAAAWAAAEHGLRSRRWALRRRLPALERPGAARDDEPPRLCRYPEVREALANPAEFSSVAWSEHDQSVLSLDPPHHAAPRAILRELLVPERIAGLEELARTAAVELARAVADEVEVDALARLAMPLAERVMAEMLGLPEDIAAQFAATARDGETEPTLAATVNAIDEAGQDARLVQELAERVGPRAGAQLAALLWVGGTLEPRRAIGSALLVLGRRLSWREALLADAGAIEPFVEEILRLHPPERSLSRDLVAPRTIGGRRRGPGTRVALSLAEANRDEETFADPGEIDLSRPSRHLSFGAGAHRCPGARLGRAQTAAAVSAVLEILPRFELLSPATALRHGPAGSLEELVIVPAPPPELQRLQSTSTETS